MLKEPYWATIQLMSLTNIIFKVLAPFLEKEGKDRTFLLKMVPREAVCAEVGVWKGSFSEEILDVIRPKRLHLIDPWKFMPIYSNRWYGGTIARSQKDMNIIYSEVKRRFRNDSRVVVHRRFSYKMIKKFRDSYFDFVYIDGDHSYSFVKKDLESFFSKVKRGGIIAGDDYISFWSMVNGFSVKKAVDEFTTNFPVKVLFLRGQFALRKI